MVRTCTCIVRQKNSMHSPLLLVELCVWTKSNRQKLNCEKTKCIWLRTYQRLKTLLSPILRVGGASIQSTSGACNLVVFFDCHLDLKLTAHLKRMSFVLHSSVEATGLPPGVLRTLLHVFMSCRLDYCNSLMSRLDVMWHTAFAVSPERCCTSIRWRVQTRQWSKYFETTYIGYRSRSEWTSRVVFCHSNR